MKKRTADTLLVASSLLLLTSCRKKGGRAISPSHNWYGLGTNVEIRIGDETVPVIYLDAGQFSTAWRKDDEVYVLQPKIPQTTKSKDYSKQLMAEFVKDNPQLKHFPKIENLGDHRQKDGQVYHIFKMPYYDIVNETGKKFLDQVDQMWAVKNPTKAHLLLLAAMGKQQFPTGYSDLAQAQFSSAASELQDFIQYVISEGYSPQLDFQEGNVAFHNGRFIFLDAVVVHLDPTQGNRNKEDDIRVVRVEKKRAGWGGSQMMRNMSRGRIHDPNQTVGATVTLEGTHQQDLRNYRKVERILRQEERKLGLFGKMFVFQNVFPSREKAGYYQAKWNIR
jgi:hypothetical protein